MPDSKHKLLWNFSLINFSLISTEYKAVYNVLIVFNVAIGIVVLASRSGMSKMNFSDAHTVNASLVLSSCFCCVK